VYQKSFAEIIASISSDLSDRMANLQKIKQLFYMRGGLLDRDQIKFACSILNSSGVIALPTDTLYGLVAKASDSTALNKIYKIKGRDPTKPLAVCVASVEAITEVADIGKISMNVFRSLLPGPVTLVLNRSSKLNKDLNPEINTIGVRVPAHSFIIALCHELGPLALTSANKSGEKSPLVIEDFKEIWDELDCIFDNGVVKDNVIEQSHISATNRAGSTVIDLTDQEMKYYKIIREGCALNRSVNILTRYGFRRKH
jgi:tRNA threonylcarbamoyl adenosine modification protein (Sua5/YciO/YrdC/YwlC family)